jgi:hypothetical protein
MVINAEEIPNWVPATVNKLAVRLSDGQCWCLGASPSKKIVRSGEEELVRRLVIDPKMKSVWQYLLRRAQPVCPEIVDEEASWTLETWGVCDMGVSVQERACALFFWFVVMEVCAPRTPATRQDIENFVAPWRSAAERCRLAIGYSGRSADDEFAKTLTISAEYFEARVRFAEQDAKVYTLKRHSGKPEDDFVRGVVRALARETYALYGLFQYEILTSVATVALQTNVTYRDVRNWCSDLRVAPEDSTAR